MGTGYSYFIEEEAEAQRGWPTCPGSHIRGDHVEGRLVSPDSEGVGSWAKELVLNLHAYLFPFLIKSWALEVQ